MIRTDSYTLKIMPAHIREFNYDFPTVEAWIKLEIKRYQADGYTIQNFCDRLSLHSDGPFTVARLNKFKNTKLKNRQKIMTKAVLQAFSNYRGETLAQTIAWAKWSEPTDVTIGKGLARRMSEAEAMIERLSAEVEALRVNGSVKRSRKKLHPFIAAVHGALSKNGVDPASIEGRKAIAAAAEGVEESNTVVEMICGDIEPKYAYLFAIGTVLNKAVGTDWFTPEVEAIVPSLRVGYQSPLPSAKKDSQRAYQSR